MDSSVVSSSSSGTAEQTAPAIQPTFPNSMGSTDNSTVLKEHPLMNPLIVDKIVDQLDPSFEQLKTLRLVSNIWTKATLHHWRNSCAVLTLIPDPTLFTGTKHRKGLPVSKFLTEFQDPESPFQLSEKPFTKYKFKGLTFDIQVCSKPGGPAQTFWNTIGPLIDSLYLESCIFLKPDLAAKVTCPMVQLLIGMIPEVKHLVLKDVVAHILEKKSEENGDDDVVGVQVFVERPHVNLRTVTVYGDMEMGDLSLEDLFRMAPNLESITGVDLPTNTMTEHTIMEPLTIVRFKPEPKEGISPLPLSNLKHLDLINSSTISEDFSWESAVPPLARLNEAVDAVVTTQLPLETLSLQIENAVGMDFFPVEDAENATGLNNYLSSFSGTLKSLKLYRHPVGPPFLTFLSGSRASGGSCEMPLLTELHLWGAIAPDFAFLKNTPNLRRLVVNLGCFEKQEQLKIWMKGRREDYGDIVEYKKYSQDMVANVRRNLKEGGGGILCSQLEYLEIDYEFREESWRILGKWMPNLKRLKTVLNRKTVSVVCEVWRELTELVCLHGSKTGDSCVIRDQRTGGFSGGPSANLKISDLKGLERLEVDSYCGESKLTEDAVFQGFLKMPALKYLRICVNGAKMSKKAEEALKKGVQFCEVIRNGRRGDDDGKEICECDRCAFRRDAERGFRDADDEEDDEDGDGFSSFGSEDYAEMIVARREQWGAGGMEGDEDASWESDGSAEIEQF